MWTYMLAHMPPYHMVKLTCQCIEWSSRPCSSTAFDPWYMHKVRGMWTLSMHIRVFAQSGYHWLISEKIEKKIISTCSDNICCLYYTTRILPYYAFGVHLVYRIYSANTLCIIFIMKTAQSTKILKYLHCIFLIWDTTLNLTSLNHKKSETFTWSHVNPAKNDFTFQFFYHVHVMF